jgi:putative transposase
MSEQTVCRKTYKEKLLPTPAQECALEVVLWRCRALYNTALEQRITAWERCHISVSRFEQAAELKEMRAELTEYAAVHSHVLQDVLARLDRTYLVFFRQVANGEKPGFPRFQGSNRYHSFTYKEYGNGARLDNGYLVLSTIGRIAVRWPRPSEGPLKTVTISTEADGCYVSLSSTEVPTQRLPLTGRETGSDVGLKVFLITADGQSAENPQHYRKAERELKKRRSSASHDGRRGARVATRRCTCSPSSISTCAANARTFTIRPRSASCASTMCSTLRPLPPPISAAVPHPSQMQTAPAAMSTMGPAARLAST